MNKGPEERQILRRFKPYPAYKDSGVEWLGEIPAHWEVKRLKYLARLNPESLGENTDPGLEIVYVDIGGVDSLGRIVERESLTFGSAPTRARRLVRDGDVIVSTVRTYLRAIAAIKNPEPNLVVSTGFAVVRPGHDLTTEYAAYALRAPYFVERVVANSTGVSFPAINESEIATYALAVPPLAEQRIIAAFLKRETAKIDALVAKKERLIELLQEKRTALITRAVTKGLDPEVPMKDSGVEWLGEIPAHWLCTRIKHRYSVQVGKMLQNEPSGPDDTMEPYLRAANIDWSGVILDDIREMWMSPADKQVFALREGDLLVSEGGDVGRSALWKGELEQCYIQNAINRVRSKGIDTTKFLYYWMYALKRAGYIDIVCNRATIAHYTAVKVADTEVALPPPDEQRAIVAFLDRETAKIDALIAKIREGIERLKEYRTALISAAVTGKIDVREEFGIGQGY